MKAGHSSAPLRHHIITIYGDFSIIGRTGRKTGATYHTPVGAIKFLDRGFSTIGIIPISYVGHIIAIYRNNRIGSIAGREARLAGIIGPQRSPGISDIRNGYRNGSTIRAATGVGDRQLGGISTC